jgi:hypothetical protein
VLTLLGRGATIEVVAAGGPGGGPHPSAGSEGTGTGIEK